MNEWLILILAVLFMLVIGVGAIAYTALDRADRALGMDVNENHDSEIWRDLLFQQFIKWIKRRAKETPWVYKFWDESQPRLKNLIKKR